MNVINEGANEMKTLFLVMVMVVIIGGLAFGGCTQNQVSSPSSSSTPAAQSSSPATTPAQAEPVVLELVTYNPDIPPGNLWFKTYIDKVSQKSGGELTIKWIGGPEAIEGFDQAPAVASGVVDMALSQYPASPPPANAFECMYIRERSCKELRESGAYDVANELFNQVGLHFLGHSPASKPAGMGGWFTMMNIEKVDDFAGMTLGCPGPTEVPVAEALESNPVMIPFAEFYTAMERGMMDGFFLCLAGVFDFGLQEVVPYHIQESFAGGNTGFLINLEKWNTLPKDLQDILVEAAAEVEDETEALWDELDADYGRQYEDLGGKIVKLSADESDKLYDLSMDASWSAMRERYPEYGPKFEDLMTVPGKGRP
jgi:TRAP-type C4-dicarboxylate transport system substrate-binding protein